MKVRKYLQSKGLLEGLATGEIDSIAEKFERVSLQPGELLFEEGSETKDVYILESGELKIFILKDDEDLHDYHAERGWSVNR